MKKEYMMPTMCVVELKQKCHILASSVKSVGGNVFNSSITGGSGDARSRECSDWDDEE